jgi:hypothetical protein
MSTATFTALKLTELSRSGPAPHFRCLLAVWTTAGVLSIVLPAAISIGLIVGGFAMRRSGSPGQQWAGSGVLFLGMLGLLASAGWLIVALYVEANVR